MMHKHTVLFAAGLLGCLVTLGGCQTNQAQERLWAENAELRAQHERDLAALDATEAELRATEAQLSGIRAELAARPQTPPPVAPGPAVRANTGFAAIEGVETVQGPGGSIAVRVPGDVLFAAGSSDLKASAKQTLAQIAAVLEQEYPGSRVRVEWYTDTDPIRKSKWRDNLELSLHRAAAVERYLVERGVSGDRVYSAGFGESDPRGTKAQSRRVEIVVMR